MAKAKAAKSGAQAVKKAIDFLAKYDKPEVTTKLIGDEREKYLKALDIAFGPKQQRMKDMGFGPEVYYHGSFQDLDRFDPRKFNVESGVGKGVYVSSSPEDAFLNYAKSEGPDVKQKIEHLALTKYLNHEKPFTAAKKKLLGSSDEGVLYPLHVKTTKTANLGPDQGDYYTDLLKSVGDEDIGLSKEAQAIKNRLWKLREKYENFDPTEVWAKILENDMPSESDLWRDMSKTTIYATDKKTGLNAANEIKRQALEAAGFDSIILEPKTVGKPAVSFGFHYNAEPGTKHLTLFKPNQVRSTQAAFDPRFKKSPLIMAGKAAAVLGASGAAEQAMAGLAPDEVAANAGEAFDKYISQPVQSLAKQTLTPSFTVRGQEVKTASPVTDMIIEGGMDPTNVMGGAGDVVELIRMLRDMRQKKAVEQ